MSKTKIYLCSFASEDLDLSVKRFFSQATDMNFYEEIKIYRPKDFSKPLRERIKNLFKKGGRNRYYGFDVWRPEIINDFLKKIPDNCILHYSDIGNHLNPKGIWRLKEYIQSTDKNYMSVFEYGDPPHDIQNNNFNFQKYYEYQNTKGDVINFFNLDYKSEIFNSPQIWGGTFFLKKSSFSENFMKQWKYTNEFTHLFNDSPSTKKNHSEFKGMRGCQSVFSIIAKLNNAYKFSAAECEWAEFNNKRIWNHLKHYPILARRDKKYNIFKRFLNRQFKTLNRIKSKFKSY